MAWLLGNYFLRWFVSTKYSRGEHCWILPEMRHRGRKGGFRDWTHGYMSLEGQSSVARRSLYLSRPCSKASSFLGCQVEIKATEQKRREGSLEWKTPSIFSFKASRNFTACSSQLRRLTLKIAHKTVGYTGWGWHTGCLSRESVMVGHAYWNMEASHTYDQTSSLTSLFRLSFTTLLKLLSSVSLPIVKDHNTARYFLALLTMCVVQNQPLPV